MAGVVDPYSIVVQCLDWIGFGSPNQRASISTEAGFNSLNDLNDIEEKDIRDMADNFQKRTIANRINFGMRRTKWLIAMMHWVQDFSHCSRQPTIDDFVTANDFKQALSTAAQHASLHKVDMDQVDTISKAADLGKLRCGSLPVYHLRMPVSSHPKSMCQWGGLHIVWADAGCWMR